MKISVKVNANASKQEIVKLNEGHYRAYLKSPARENKANLELISLLKKYFKAQVRIVKGFGSKNKIIELLR